MRYLLQKSETHPLWWVLTDTEAQIVCRFKEGDFNGSQKFTLLHDAAEYDAAALPGIAARMADWLRDNHYEIVFSSPQEITRKTLEAIGAKIKAARNEKGWSLGHLAKMTGIPVATIELVESGETDHSISTLSVIADALSLDLRLYEN